MEFPGYQRVIFNGQREYVAEGTSLFQFLQNHRFDLEWLIVEHNRRIVRPGFWDRTDLHDGDRIEVLTFSGEGI